MSVFIVQDEPRKVRHFKLAIDDDYVAVRFGSDVDPEKARARILQALDAILPDEPETRSMKELEHG